MDVLRAFQRQVGAMLTYTAVASRRIGMGAVEVAALEHLATGGELTPGQLGQRLALSSGSMTGLVDRMERAGLIERVANPRDRRSWLLRITASGRRDGRAYLAPIGADLRDAIADLTADECLAVLRFTDLVTATIEQHSGETAAPPDRS